MNIFRHLGDFSHLASKIILIFAIHSRHSAEGISLLTQAMYMLLFSMRYLDLFKPISWTHHAAYNTPFKLVYLGTSAYILYLMLRRYPRTRESEQEYRLAGYILVGSLLATPIFMAFFYTHSWGLVKFFEQWSLVIECVAVLPQITLLSHTAIPTAITSWYLVALGSYRGWYILNWIWRVGVQKDGFDNWTSVVCGVIQTLIYIEFAYIYWNRQKVKLGRGGVLDKEEFARGLVLGRLLGGQRSGLGGSTGGWRGGVSVSADDFEVAAEESDDDIEEETVGGRDRSSEDEAERGLVSGQRK